MSSLRTALLVAVTIGLIFGLMGPVFAQQSDAIYIANGVVARVRTPGPYESLYQRSAAIDQAIAEVISTQDTQNPLAPSASSQSILRKLRPTESRPRHWLRSGRRISRPACR